MSGASLTPLKTGHLVIDAYDDFMKENLLWMSYQDLHEPGEDTLCFPERFIIAIYIKVTIACACASECACPSACACA